MTMKKINSKKYPKCGKPMRLLSTGSIVRTFQCPECRHIEIVKRDDHNDDRQMENRL